jgi:glutamate-ammonia-ligase adenylyltransferase
MSFAGQITRLPRPFDPDRGREAVALCPDLPVELAELVTGAAGCSPYLAQLIAKEAVWLSSALDTVDASMAAELDRAADWRSSDLDGTLRQSKRRIALLIALADLGGVWSLFQVTEALTGFADTACQSALRAAIAVQIKRGKLPGMTEDDIEDAAGMCVLAMGKMGAGELNYSSDIDLICLFDETRFDPGDYHDARAGFVRATRMMSACLSEMTAQGYVFRTDLRLRPDPAVTPVCISMETAERYYESLGRTWERAAFIKARVAAGDAVAGARFLKELTPFVWRRHLDFAAIQDAHDMRLAIREHKGTGRSVSLPGHNMKLGRGGIREIEFFTQTRQLIAGGRDPDLRCRGTVPGLTVLAQKGWVPADVAATLTDHYIAHRTVEHRLQMVQDAQTHNLPKTPEGFARLAAMMDRDVAELEADLAARLTAVHDLTEGFFAPSAPAAEAPAQQLDPAMRARWLSYPALRSERSRVLFKRLQPDLLDRLSKSSRPEEALHAFDGFLSGLPAGVQLFSLLEANPQLLDLLVDITGTSTALAQYLSQNAGVFDAVIGGDFFADWPGQTAIADLLQARLAAETDYETQLDVTRRWVKEWHFRVGVHLLRGLVTPDIAAGQYADIAQAVLAVLWPRVTATFATRHGPPPGRGAVVLGMGSLGAGALNAGSDLDLIVIYDPQDIDYSEGQKPLASRLYYARLTQALITALTAPMAQGKLYEVDMRLRPSGNQGPVATSWGAFQSYQKDEAWVWEHLALTRARVVAGPQALAEDVEAFRLNLLSQPRPPADVAAEVADMRARIRAAKTPANLWEVKIGPGRLQDIELIAQAGALVAGVPVGDTVGGLSEAQSAGFLSPDEARSLSDTAQFFVKVHMAAKLLSDKPLDTATLGPAGRAFLLRTLKEETVDALEGKLAEDYEKTDRLISRLLADYAPKDSADEEGK